MYPVSTVTLYYDKIASEQMICVQITTVYNKSSNLVKGTNSEHL